MRLKGKQGKSHWMPGETGFVLGRGRKFNELSDVSRESFRRRGGGTPCLLLAASSEKREKRHTWRRKEPLFAVFEDPLPSQMTTDAEIKK